MLDNVRVAETIITFDLALGSSVWHFLLDREVIQFLARCDLTADSHDYDVQEIFDENADFLGRIAAGLIREKAPSDHPIEITVDDLP